MKTAALGEVAEIVSGATPKSSVSRFWGGGIPWVTPADLSSLTGPYISETPRTLTADGLASCSARLLPPHSVLLSSRAPIGHVAINTVPMATNQGFKNLVPLPDKLDSKYLYHWLKASRDYLQGLGNGATFKELSKESVARVVVPLPSLDGQRRIAAILDRTDSLRLLWRAVLGLADQLFESEFRSSFTKLPATAVVADVAARIRTGPFGSQLLHSEFVNHGVAVLGLDNVVSNRFRWTERRYITPSKYERLRRYTVQPGDVLISIMGTTGRCVVVPDSIPLAINTKHICAVTVDPDVLDPAFLRAAFLWHPESREHLRKQTKGSVMDGLNMGIIKTMPVPVPPIELQREFADRVRSLDALRSRVEQAMSLSDELFACLQAWAFRGEPVA